MVTKCKTNKVEMEAVASRLVANEVNVCVSGIVSHMADKCNEDLMDMADGRFLGGYVACSDCDGRDDTCGTCGGHGEILEEVYEYWSVSSFLGEKLAASGEIVENDFFGLVVWGRRTTGQAISADHVIECIAKDTM